MLHTPIYDPSLSYEENYKNGPFGDYANGKAYLDKGSPNFTIFGNNVFLPFGLPAGPLLNANFIQAAFAKGYDVGVYKTVRSASYPCHPAPNIVPVDIKGDLKQDRADQGVIQATKYIEPIAITNSFGVPSMSPDVWQPDMKKAVDHTPVGKLVIGSFQGTNRGKGVDEFIQDHVVAAHLVMETGVKVMEVNLSCPNEGTTNLLCFDTDRVEQITSKIKEEIGSIPLIIKLAYFTDQNHLSDYVKRIGKIVDGMAAINTISAKIVDKRGNQALPGEGRLRSGVCGAPIKWAGIDMVKRLSALRKENNMKFVIIGGGGLTVPQDYFDYKKAGADVVMSATGAMWNPYLAQEIKKQL